VSPTYFARNCIGNTGEIFPVRGGADRDRPEIKGNLVPEGEESMSLFSCIDLWKFGAENLFIYQYFTTNYW